MGAVALTVVVIFIIQNAHSINMSFLEIHLVLPLATALILAVVAGVLLLAAAGPARITQLRQILRRARQSLIPGEHSQLTAAIALFGSAMPGQRSDTGQFPGLISPCIAGPVIGQAETFIRRLRWRPGRASARPGTVGTPVTPGPAQSGPSGRARGSPFDYSGRPERERAALWRPQRYGSAGRHSCL